jgi:exopolyphosphatase/guanosine-5'-triphosphate,3'-diphosphate pyrophosphatase
VTRRLAIIDLGTNSARLLVADVGEEGTSSVVTSHRIPCRLGADLAETGRIDAEAEERTARALQDLLRRSAKLGQMTLRIVATHALRTARNGVAVQGRLEACIGAPITCLSGEREAHLVLLAAHQLVRPSSEEPLVAVDLGGGSLEFAVQPAHAARSVPPRLLSLPLGAVVVSEGVSSGIVSSPALQSLQERVARVLQSQAAFLRDVARVVVVSGGTAVCAAALLGFESPWNGARFAVEALEGLKRQLAVMEHAERAALPAIADRADIIVAGMVVLQQALQHVGAAQCIVLEHGVREGALLALSRDEL